jgi:hypothetical protein
LLGDRSEPPETAGWLTKQSNEQSNEMSIDSYADRWLAGRRRDGRFTAPE